MNNKTLFLTLLTLFIVGLTFESQAKVVYVSKRPPARKVVVVKPKPPVYNAIWISGRWSWNGHKYVWSAGRWEKPRKGYVWVKGHWKKL